MNGVGNGAMIGSLPAIAITLYNKVTGKHFAKTIENNSLWGTVIGSVVGAVYGIKEAKELNEYRTNLRNELVELHRKIDESQEKKSWVEKEALRPIALDEPSR